MQPEPGWLKLPHADVYYAYLLTIVTGQGTVGHLSSWCLANANCIGRLASSKHSSVDGPRMDILFTLCSWLMPCTRLEIVT